MTTQIAQWLFTKLDSNSDGGIDATELSSIASSGQTQDISQLFSRLLTNFSEQRSVTRI